MNEDIKFVLDSGKEDMEKAISHIANELNKIRAGKARPAMVEGIMVEYYGSMVPLSQVATVGTPDARTLVIKPWEKKMIAEIEKAVNNSDIGIRPQNDGEQIRLNVPPLTEERRRELVKNSKTEIESGKVRIRNIRKETNEELRKLLKNGVSEDEVKNAEEKVQQLTDQYIAKLDQQFSAKEAEIMTV
jgi:ribosome recycling factor